MNNQELDQDAADARRGDSGPSHSEEFEGFEETAAALGLASAPLSPPDALRARLMAQISLTPQRDPLPEVSQTTETTASVPHGPPTPVAGTASASGALSDNAGPAAANSSRSVTPGPAARRAARRWSPLTIGIVSAAAAVALFFGGAAFGQLGASLGTQEVPLAGQAEELVSIAAAPDAQNVVVPLDDGGSATLLWSGQLGQSALFVDGLPTLAESQSYQLWYIGENGPVSAGLLEQGASGPSWRVLDGHIAAGDVVGVTVEPAGGSTQPTSDPVLAIQS